MPMIRHLGLKAYGKINLGLDVLGKREDGYHEVRMIMQTVGLYDKIDLYLKETPGITVETNLYYLPVNENNLVYKAAKLLMDAFHINHGVTNNMFNLGLSMEDLMKRGVKIGADVPYCVMRGTALSEGIGEILTPLPSVPQCQVLIAKPGISVSTKFVYEHLDAASLRPADHPDIDGMIAAIKDRDIYGTASLLGNVLETVTIPEYPVIAEIKERLKSLGAVNALMSGSGPTVFGIFTSPKAAEEAYEEMRYGRSANLAKSVYLTNFYNTKEVSHGK